MEFLKEARRQLLEIFLKTMSTKYEPEALIAARPKKWAFGARQREFADLEGLESINQGIVQTYEKVGRSIQNAINEHSLGQPAVSITGEHEFGAGIRKIQRLR